MSTVVLRILPATGITSAADAIFAHGSGVVAAGWNGDSCSRRFASLELGGSRRCVKSRTCETPNGTDLTALADSHDDLRLLPLLPLQPRMRPRTQAWPTAGLTRCPTPSLTLRVRLDPGFAWIRVSPGFGFAEFSGSRSGLELMPVTDSMAASPRRPCRT